MKNRRQNYQKKIYKQCKKNMRATLKITKIKTQIVEMVTKSVSLHVTFMVFPSITHVLTSKKLFK